MKKLGCLLFTSTGILFSFPLHVTHYDKPQQAYIVYIKSSPLMEKIPAISCLYHGSALLCKDGYARIPESELRSFFSIVITPRIEFIQSGSTKYMKRIKKLPCKWYNISLRFEDSLPHKKKSYYWDIEELNPKKMPLRLPDDASIVFELSPEMVQKLENPEKTGPYAIKLPSIRLKDTVTANQLEDALESIAAYAPERNINCTKPISFWKKEGNTMIQKNEVR